MTHQDMSVSEIMASAHTTARAKGWWDEDQMRSFGELIALCHAELSEALEAYRDDPGGMATTVVKSDGKPEGVTSELADVIIRIADLAQAYGLPLARVLAEKMAYNETRSYRHGGKAL